MVTNGVSSQEKINQQINCNVRHVSTQTDNGESNATAREVNIVDKRIEKFNVSEIASNSNKQDEFKLVKSDFVLNEIVWAKIRGSTYWPTRIDRYIYIL